MPGTKSTKRDPFDVESYLNTSGIAKRIANFRARDVIFTQGGQCDSVMYIRRGTVKLTITSPQGKEVATGLLYAGDFLSAGCIAGQPYRSATAIVLEAATVLVIKKTEMMRVIREERTFSDYFVYHMLRRNVRIEEDLTDQLFNLSEKRLARILLLLARSGRATSGNVAPKISQETLAEMVGTTRSRVNTFMNKFRRLGYIDYNGGLHVNTSLLRVVHDSTRD